MKKKKKSESIDTFMSRRNKETGKVLIPQTKPSPKGSAGSHQTLAKQLHVGVVKTKMAKKLEKIVKKKKKVAMTQVFQ